MNWNYSYTPSIWPSIVTFLLMIALAIYSGRRRSVPGATPFFIACLFASGWAAGSIMEYSAVDLETKITWIKLQGVCQLPIVTAITCFFLEYAWPGRWLTRRNLILLSIPCLLTLGLMLTNNLHHLIWLGFAYEGRVVRLHNPANWILIAYAFVGLGFLNLLVFAWLFLHSPQHRWPVVIMLTGQLAGRTAFALDSAKVFPTVIPIGMLGMAFEFLMYTIALYGFRILDPIPLARRTAIEQLNSGIVVLDPQGKIVSLNPAACTSLGSPSKQLLGHSIQDVLPSYADLIGDLRATKTDQIEISMGSGSDTRFYELEASHLNDWRGLEVGLLLMLRDVTGQKQTQAQIVEQQRVLAILQERQRLARELHDSAGQVLGFVSLQTQAISSRVNEGDIAEANNQLDRLADITRDAHADLRDSILSLNAGAREEWSFLNTLRHHLETYQIEYGVRTELIIPDWLEETSIGAEEGVQVMRVIQEALSNARRHGRASCVQVTFGREHGQIQVFVTDNGRGFDLAGHSDSDSGHYGLSFMGERMAQIGGRLVIHSRPDAGTQIVIQLPTHGTF